MLSISNNIKKLIKYLIYNLSHSLQLVIINSIKTILISLWVKTILNFKFINTYYLRNEHLWLDGFLFDFLQKKTADIWVRKFVIYTGFLFSERLVFDAVVKLYIDYFVWYMHKFTIFEVSNVFEMLTIVVYFAVTLFFSMILLIILF
jgi:hypothetical protein